MSEPRMRIADLDQERLEKLKKLEGEIGAVILALEPQYMPADLTEEQIAKLRALEDELGVVLLAYHQT